MVNNDTSAALFCGFEGFMTGFFFWAKVNTEIFISVFQGYLADIAKTQKISYKKVAL